jgi:ferredoxin-thioredoxin reductase catalytic chain
LRGSAVRGAEEMGDGEIERVIAIWKDFVARQHGGEGSFGLNPDEGRVRMLAQGVLDNERNHGLKYCPCRMTTKNREEDLKLVCPCNFRAQKTWREKGECWCSLFVRAKR